jgi:aspartyl-tRNA synthetase
MGYIFWREEGGMEGAGPLAKNIGPERTEAIRQQLGLGVGDAAFFLAGKPSKFEAWRGRARDVIGEELGLTDEERFAFAGSSISRCTRRTRRPAPRLLAQPVLDAAGRAGGAGGRSAGGAGLPVRLACNGYELVRARSGTTSPRSCSRRSRSRAMARTRCASASAAWSTRSATARRPMAAARRASTAS